MFDLERTAYECVHQDTAEAAPAPRGVGNVAAVALTAVLALVAVTGWAWQKQTIVDTPLWRIGSKVVHSGRDGTDNACEFEDDVFLPGNDLQKIRGVASAEECCDECRAHKKCLAWSWGKASSEQYSSICFLKGAAPRPLTKVASPGFVSGQTHQMEKEGAPLEVKSPAQGQSLYCFSLVQPEGYELDLVQMQFQEKASIFICDEYALYSNKRFEVTPMLWTGVINSTMQCEMGGEFGTALNTGIFLALWARIILDGRFLYHDWSVKVDPDAFFSPDRLRSHLMNHLEEARGVYINNCKFGMHGPLEVFSRNAVKAWALGAGKCVKYFTELCSGPCGWGEDMFMDQCMQKQLNVRRDNDFALLLEDHCDPPKNWDDCSNTSAASFHPFKTKAGWMMCLNRVKSSTNELMGMMRK